MSMVGDWMTDIVGYGVWSVTGLGLRLKLGLVCDDQLVFTFLCFLILFGTVETEPLFGFLHNDIEKAQLISCESVSVASVNAGN